MIHQSREPTAIQRTSMTHSEATFVKGTIEQKQNLNIMFEAQDMDQAYRNIFGGHYGDQAVPEFYANSPTPITSNYDTMGTATLTPTTLASIEQSIMSMDTHQHPSMYTQSGSFVPPMLDQTLPPYPPQNPWASSCDEKPRGPVIMGPPLPQQPPPRRKGGRKPKNDPLPPLEAEKRRLRRLRNKEAAAKCRQRRLDHTAVLLQQIEQLEKDQAQFERTINELKYNKEQCEFALQSHRTNCNKFTATGRRKQANPAPRLNIDSCAEFHRRSSSSESDLQSPPIILP